jgi:hypothetical protein
VAVQVDLGLHGERDRVEDEENTVDPRCPSLGEQCSRITPESMPRCRPDAAALPVSAVLEHGDSLEGRVVTVHGLLRRSHWGLDDAARCPDRRACCDPVWRFLGLSDVRAPHERPSVLLWGSEQSASHWRCEGSRSLTCCRTAGLGQTVLATGELESTRGYHQAPEPEPSRCSPDASSRLAGAGSRGAPPLRAPPGGRVWTAPPCVPDPRPAPVVPRYFLHLTSVCVVQ